MIMYVHITQTLNKGLALLRTVKTITSFELLI